MLFNSVQVPPWYLQLHFHLSKRVALFAADPSTALKQRTDVILRGWRVFIWPCAWKRKRWGGRRRRGRRWPQGWHEHVRGSWDGTKPERQVRSLYYIIPNERLAVKHSYCTASSSLYRKSWWSIQGWPWISPKNAKPIFSAFGGNREQPFFTNVWVNSSRRTLSASF